MSRRAEPQDMTRRVAIAQKARSVILLTVLLAAGCSRTPPQQELTLAAAQPISMVGLPEPQFVESVEAVCVPPLAWLPDPLKESERHTHQVWISPSGDTAYGVIRIKLPLPVGVSWVLWGFMDEMRRSEGEGQLLEKHDDPGLPGIRFVAEGGHYKVRTNLIVRGFRAWAIYAGSLRARPENAEELELAERARECTRVGTPKPPRDRTGQDQGELVNR
jgi:hypothetical protein